MNEEEKRNLENNIEEKFKNMKEKDVLNNLTYKDVLNNLTYAECLFILTPENKYGDEIKELSLLKLCEIIEKQQKEIENKDKIIDEMATYIVTLDIEEDICKKTKNEHCDKMNFGECEDCIKQYFERKVEGK